MVLEKLGLTDAKEADTPGTKSTTVSHDSFDPLNAEETFLFRSCAGALLYISADRIETQYAQKKYYEVCQHLRGATCLH